MVGTSVVEALSGILIPISRPLAESLSTTPGVLVSGMAIMILVVICSQLSVSISGLQKQVQKLAKEVALQNVKRKDSDVSED